MVTYNLILKNYPNKLPAEIVLEDVNEPQVPPEGATIRTDYLSEYIRDIATKTKYKKYVKEFSSQRFRVTQVEHFPGHSKTGLESDLMSEGEIMVTAIKI